MSTSHFFAYLSRMKFIRRWGLMHSTYPENIQEHSLRVAQIAHALAIIKNRLFGGDVSVTGRSGEGTRVAVSIPLGKAKAGA